MSTSIEATILESRFEHFSEDLFDGKTVYLGLDVDEGRLHATASSGDRASLRLCSEPFEPHVPVCEPSRLIVLPGFTDEGYEADWHIYPACSCGSADFESLLADLNKIGWPTVRTDVGPP